MALTSQVLHQLITSNKIIPCEVAGYKFLLDARGALFWPQKDVLIFSDLHLEKGSFLSQFANPLPRFDTRATINAMKIVIKDYACNHVVCLGDSFHDGNAQNRMQTSDVQELNALVSSLPRWTWVLGNHDPDIPRTIVGDRAPNLLVEDMLLVHEPVKPININKKAKHNEQESIHEAEAAKQSVKQDTHTFCAQIVGHYHPKMSCRIANKKITGKIFVCASDILLMPAFGTYTGGLDIHHEAYNTLIDIKKVNTYLMHKRHIYKLKPSQR